MSVKIMIHIGIEITDDGRVNVAKASWTPTRQGGDRRPVRTEEITAIAAAVIKTQQVYEDLPEDPPDSVELIDTTLQLPFDELGTPPHNRGQYMAGPGPSQGPPRPPAAAGAAPRPAAGGTSLEWAMQCLVSAGVTAILAKSLAAAAGPSRAAEIGNWMRAKGNIRNADAMATKLLAQAQGGPGQRPGS